MQRFAREIDAMLPVLPMQGVCREHAGSLRQLLTSLAVQAHSRGLDRLSPLPSTPLRPALAGRRVPLPPLLLAHRTVHGSVAGVKVSFLEFAPPLLEPTIEHPEYVREIRDGNGFRFAGSSLPPPEMRQQTPGTESVTNRDQA